MEKYEISEQFLEEAIEKSSRSLVGKACKRFEILKDKESIKSAVKELIYEQFRNLKEIIKSFNTGVKFKTKRDK